MFDYDKETGITKCTVSDGQNTFVGIAKCSPEDKEAGYQSEYTGCDIAEKRAHIKVLQHIKNNQIIPQIQAYEHLISTMIKSTRFNPKSYEFQRIKAEYDNLIKQYEEIKKQIAWTYHDITSYLTKKNSVNRYIDYKNMEKKLDDYGISMKNPDGSFRNTQEVLSDIADAWNKLGNINQIQIPEN